MLGDGLGCYDLDHCTDEQVRRFAETIPELVIYAERSMSGSGAHIFIEAPPGPGWKRTINGLSVERYTWARFIRMTGSRITA
jgi:primase-polymerase (primpol)-like protein